MISGIESHKVKQAITLDLSWKDTKRAWAILTETGTLFVIQTREGRRKVTLTYRDKYSYSCERIAAGTMFATVTGSCLITEWSKLRDQAYIIFALHREKMIPVFQKLGGAFTVEYADINNDGHTDLLITEQSFPRYHRKNTQKCSIYLRRINHGKTWFVLWKRVDWKKRLGTK